MCRILAPALSLIISLLVAGPAAAADQAVCPPVPAAGDATCYAEVLVAGQSQVAAASSSATFPAGYHPADLQAAYGLRGAAGAYGGSQTIAIVDAYDDPYAASNLATYRSTFGLAACSSTTGCFRKVNQTGSTSLPAASTAWAKEISLDLDMASAICPNCRILLVEARSTSFTDLLAAEDYATSHATVVSNTWGAPEFSSERVDDPHFRKPLPITVSSGDSGYGVQYPAASPYVTAVGGTTLQRSINSPRGFNESAWSGTGSGCSVFEPKPAWQHDLGCRGRTVADVSADADPNTGVAVYDSYGAGGWQVFGGTSASSPIVAATYALAGGFKSDLYGSLPYAHTPSLFGVIGGSNGTCSFAYLCIARGGYSGPTGLGSPNGIGAF